MGINSISPDQQSVWMTYDGRNSYRGSISNGRSRCFRRSDCSVVQLVVLSFLIFTHSPPSRPPSSPPGVAYIAPQRLRTWPTSTKSRGPSSRPIPSSRSRYVEFRRFLSWEADIVREQDTLTSTIYHSKTLSSAPYAFSCLV